MSNTKEEFKCPNCKKKNRIKIKMTATSEEIDRIITRELFTFVCKNCNESIIIDHPLRVVGSNYVIHYTPGSEEELQDEDYEYMRVCGTFADFKEKLMVLEDGLNDIVIEFVKYFLKNQLDEDMQNEITDIRYDGMNEENLIFYLMGPNKSIGCSKDFYQEILKKSKIKRIKKCVNIDFDTFKKYFKMR